MFSDSTFDALFIRLNLGGYTDPPPTSPQLDDLLGSLPLNIAHQLSIIRTWSLMSEEELVVFVVDAVTPVMSTKPHATITLCLESFIQTRRWNQVKTKKKRAHRTLVEEFSLLLIDFKPYPYPIDTDKYCWMHQLRVGPASMVLDGPYIDQTNRVVRNYSQYISHFLQVAFVGLDGSQIGQYMFYNEEYSEYHFEGKIKHFLENGVRVSGRLFKFLAFSSSSLREGRFLFFHEPEEEDCITVDSIRDWMGDFSLIKSPARYAARMAQALTSTTPTIEIEPHEVQMYAPDVERNGYVFSDGNGTISQELADNIWESLKKPSFKSTFNNSSNQERGPTPSAFQIRFGGAKGMISVDPSLYGRRLVIRKSMIKFPSPNCKFLEVADYSSSSRPAFFNRQVILVLEDLGVPKSVFHGIQQSCLLELSALQTSPEKLVALAGRMGHFGNFSRLVQNLKVPEWIENDFVRTCLDHVRSYFLKEIKYKARMKIPDGWTLLGVLDETGLLKEGEIFVSLSDADNLAQPRILTGQVVVYRSPCLHPGDIQPATAVNNAYLHHLRNVVVFSQHGSRDMPSKLAGGDLDGDMFTVICDPSLFPPSFHAPGAYTAPAQTPAKRNVTIRDITDFIVHFLKNNNLGTLSIRHMLLADISPGGVKHPSCLKLTEMCSTAVDFPKTGVAADIKNAPECRTRPDYLCRRNQQLTKKGVYKSVRVMGEMFRDPDLNQMLRRLTYHQQINSHVDDSLWRFAQRNSLSWREVLETAKEYQDVFEEEVFMIASYCDPPLTELELWTGCIDMTDRNYHRTGFNLESWALDQFGTLISKTQKNMVSACGLRIALKDLAAACFYVANVDARGYGYGKVFGLLLFHHLA